MERILLLATPDKKSFEIHSERIYHRTKDYWWLLQTESFLKNNGYNVLSIPGIYTYEKMKRMITKEIKKGVDLVFMCPQTYEYLMSEKIATYIKSIDNEALIVLGGPHVTYTDMKVLKECPYIDIVIRKEFENGLLEILRNYPNLANIKGITYRNERKIKRNKGHTMLNSVPSISEKVLKRYLSLLLDEYESKNIDGVIYYTSLSRGCYYNCSFCTDPKFWCGVKYRDIQNLFLELDMLEKHKKIVKDLTIDFFDASLTSNKNILKILTSEIKKRDYSFSFRFNARVNEYTKEITGMLKNSAFNSVKFGIEHIHPAVLRLMNKKINKKMIETALSNAKNLGQYVYTNWIIGHPGDSYKRSMVSYLYARKLIKNRLTDEIRVFNFIPYPGTEAFHHPEKFGLRFSLNDLLTQNGDLPIVEYKDFSKKQMLFMLNLFNSLNSKNLMP